MKFFLDTANLEEIRTVHRWGILAGITTNPTLVSREGMDYRTVVREIAFFFQAEDGIRDLIVTGVQTCALPISHAHHMHGHELMRLGRTEEAIAEFLKTKSLE